LRRETSAPRKQGLRNCKFQEGDAADLRDLKDATFDLVFSIFGAKFAPKPLDVAKEMTRMTGLGGRIARIKVASTTWLLFWLLNRVVQLLLQSFRAGNRRALMRRRSLNGTRRLRIRARTGNGRRRQ
jgi:ubiquinone/menaquinone biosynthesis C-methylase UbiE